MQLTRERRFTIQMQQFETYQFGATVTMDHHDIGYSDENLAECDMDELGTVRAELTEAVLKELDEQLLQEVKDSAEITKNRKSYILRFLGIEETPTRTRRKRAH